MNDYHLGNLGYFEDVKKMYVVDQTHNSSMPYFFDLRQEYLGCFTPVVNQGQCGSCWSFAVANTISDAYAIQNAKLNGSNSCDKYVNMSEEDLIWCSTATGGRGACNGGNLGLALDYVADHGISTEKCNPYGHGSGHDSLNYGGCPTQCKGTGNISNRVTPVGYVANCKDTDYGAKDAYGDNCSAYNSQPHWCGKYDSNEFKSNEMCCVCKGAKKVNPQTTAEIQSYIYEYGPMTVGMPVYGQLYNIGSDIYKPEAGKTNEGGHAIECLGWGHDENGEGFWIMKNSWGCNWGDAGYFKQSWAFNEESYFQAIKVNGNSEFHNDVPLAEEPACKVPEDSNNSDHCAQYSEFGKCKLCNSGYELQSDSSCKLKDQQIDEEDESDQDHNSEDIYWATCKADNGVKGYQCDAGQAHCYTLSCGQEVNCATWLKIVEQYGLKSPCSLCPAPEIANCKTQSGDQCLQCASGYSSSSNLDACLKDTCDSPKESTTDGDCVTPCKNCEPGSSKQDPNTNYVQCLQCKPGFEMSGGYCYALPDPSNCAEVELSNPERLCTVCASGYYVGPYGKCHLIEQEDTLTIETGDYQALPSQAQMSHIDYNSQDLVIRFEVQAKSDANVALTVDGDETQNMFEIVFGGWGNTWSTIRNQKRGNGLAYYKGKVLDQDAYESFWITYNKNGTLKVGKGKKLNQELMLQYYSSFVPINIVKIQTLSGVTGSWKFAPQSLMNRFIVLSNKKGKIALNSSNYYSIGKGSINQFNMYIYFTIGILSAITLLIVIYFCTLNYNNKIQAGIELETNLNKLIIKGDN